jgi:lysophospholipid acyltransferase (LPLAT)-like uncharacterized protein
VKIFGESLLRYRPFSAISAHLIEVRVAAAETNEGPLAKYVRAAVAIADRSGVEPIVRLMCREKDHSSVPAWAPMKVNFPMGVGYVIAGA